MQRQRQDKTHHDDAFEPEPLQVSHIAPHTAPIADADERRQQADADLPKAKPLRLGRRLRGRRLRSCGVVTLHVVNSLVPD